MDTQYSAHLVLVLLRDLTQLALRKLNIFKKSRTNPDADFKEIHLELDVHLEVEVPHVPVVRPQPELPVQLLALGGVKMRVKMRVK